MEVYPNCLTPVATSDKEDAWLRLILAKYDISWSRGFLPDQDPLLKFQDPYFCIWDEIFRDLTSLIAKRKLREAVDKMPLLDPRKLSSMKEWQRAHMILSVIGGSYVWQNGENDAAKVFPKCLAIPWVTVAEHVGCNPVPCHNTCVLNNWKIVDKTRPLDVSNVDTQFSFTGDKGEHWFFMLTLQVELEAASGIRNSLVAQKAVRNDDPDLLEKSLISIRQSIERVANTLCRMYERCDPKFFYGKLRTFLAGWKNNKTLPEGIIYEGVSSEPLQFYGGSEAQSSIFQTFDAVFGIVHRKAKDGKPSYLESMLNYMPRGHRDFILFIKTGPSIREYVKKFDDDHLKKLYNACIEGLLQFRNFHIQVVARYVTIQAANEKHHDLKMLAKRGTGGTGVMSFLKSIRKDTAEAMIKST